MVIIIKYIKNSSFEIQKLQNVMYTESQKKSFDAID